MNDDRQTKRVEQVMKQLPWKFRKFGYLKRIARDLPAAKWLKGDGKWRSVSCITLMALVYNYFQACKLKEIGHGSIRWTYQQFVNVLSHIDVPIKFEWLEDLLWSSNMLDEIGRFQHPLGSTFDQLLQNVLTKKERFDKITNLIEQIEDDKNV